MGKVTIAPLDKPEVVQAEQILIDNPEIIDAPLFSEPTIIEKIVEIRNIEVKENSFDDSHILKQLDSLKQIQDHMVSELDAKSDKLVVEEIEASLRNDKAVNLAHMSALRIQTENNHIEAIARMTMLENRINEIDNKKVTEIIRLKPQVPKSIIILTALNLILTIIAFLT